MPEQGVVPEDGMTLEDLLAWGTGELDRSGVPEAGLDAWYLLQACYDDRLSRSDYFLRKKEDVPPVRRQQYERLLAKRKERMPLQYITGETEFMGLSFLVNAHVLIPRQDTEVLVETVCPLCGGKRVLDLCTGSGCIGLSIGGLAKPARLVLSDVSGEALRVAEKNWKRLRERGEYPPSVQTEFVCGDLFENIEGVFDCIVSNPPYIESGIIPGLMPEVARYEPVTALDGGGDGLDFYRRIIQSAPLYLCAGGTLSFETGYDQGAAVSSLMRDNGFGTVRIRKDLAGHDRVVSGVLKERGKG